MNFRLGENFGELILKIAQENILAGRIGKAISTYTESFPGMTEEHVIKILQNKYVVIPTNDGGIVLSDEESEVKSNSKHIFDWNYLIEWKFKELDQITGDIAERFNMLETADDFPHMDTYRFLKLDFEQLLIRQVDYTDIALKFMNGEESEEFDKLYDYCADENDDEVKLYHALCYIKDIHKLHVSTIKLLEIYNWLRKHDLVGHIRFAENSFEKAFYRLEQFINSCDFKFKGNYKMTDYKMRISHEIGQYELGQEYVTQRCLRKHIEDGYDAGWLTPEGDFYGENGETSALIHMNLAEKILKFKQVPIVYAGNDDYALELNGWIKIHHEEVYGVFKYDKQDEGRALYCPTDIQVKKIAAYIDKYYGGTFHNQAYICGGKDVKTSQLKQADEIQLHKLFSDWL